MTCAKCGRDNPEGANFCPHCGAPLVAEDATMSISPVDVTGEIEVPPGLDELAADQALLVVKRGPNAGSKYLIDRDVTTLGRHPESEIFLDDVTVSRRHAEVQREGMRFVVKDAGSLNGTYVNRTRVESAELVGGDEVQVGKFKLVFFSSPKTGA